MSEALHDRLPARDMTRVRDAERAGLRASDADRDQVAAALGGAMAVGRLTSTEYAERLDATYAARTMGELAPLISDLPAEEFDGGSLAATERAVVSARFSKLIRSGRWVAGRRTRLSVRFGALIINLADAVLPGREVTVEIDAFCGKLIIVVPPGAHVIDEGGALFAKRAIYGRDPGGEAAGPVIRLVGDARFSKVAVFRGRIDPAAPWQHQLEQWRHLRG